MLTEDFASLEHAGGRQRAFCAVPVWPIGTRHDAIDDAAGVIGVGQHLAIRIIRIGHLQQPVPGVVLVLEWGSVATPVPGPPAIWYSVAQTPAYRFLTSRPMK